MEKIEKSQYIKYKHETTYRGENIAAIIEKQKSDGSISIYVYTPASHSFMRDARFYRKEKSIKSMREARRFARDYITEATTDIDTHLSEKDSVEKFFDSVNEQVNSLEGRAQAIEQEFDKELEKI